MIIFDHQDDLFEENEDALLRSERVIYCIRAFIFLDMTGNFIYLLMCSHE